MPKVKPGESRTGKNRISKSTTTDGSEQSSTKMEEKRNNRQSDSSASQSDSTGDISSSNDDSAMDDYSDDDSSNNEDETKDDNPGGDISSNNEDETKDDNSGGDISSNNEDETKDDNSGDAISSNNDDETKDDNSGDAISSNNDDETTSDNTLKSILSIYKLANNRLPGLEKNKDDIKKFGECIKEKLIKSGMDYKGDNGDKCKPYHLMHFFYCTKEKNNVTAVQIGEQLAYPGGIGDCPGDRRSGNILVFYRLKTKVPEAFFLCQGFGFHCILCLSDPSFRTRVVKRFMDGKKIKEIETFSIVGSDIDSKNIYQDFCNIAAVSFLERAIVKLTGRIIENSELDNLIQRDGSEAILMTVGLNFVKIGKPFEWKEWTKVLELFSNEKIEVEGPNRHIWDALEYVRRVEDKKSRKLNRTITKKVIDIIANNTLTFSYFLSHRYVRDWSLSSNVILKEQQTILCKEIKSWHSAPTLSMVIKAINRHFTQSPPSIRTQLTDRKIMLSYDSEKGMKNIPVQNYVHGCVSQDGDQYYKIAQKWFSLSSTYSQVVDEKFADMTQCMLVDKRISDLMKYSWRPHKLEITRSDFCKILEVSSNKTKKILQMLRQEYKLVDETNQCCLTNQSCLLPQSSELYKELAKKVEGKKVGKMLYQVLTVRGKPIEDIDVLTVLQKERKIVVMEADKYVVCNPILTEDMMKQIKRIVPSLEESRLSNFLRSMIPLSEGDYNALYLNCEKDTNFIIFPGDKVLANKVELFDILVHDKEKRTTYLFHNKEGFNHHTRDACAQIRNSSELLWHDFVRGQQNHLKLFWESAVNPKKAETPYRYFLQRKLKELGQKTFLKMFDVDTKIVFVLGFVIFQSKASTELQWKFKSLILSDFQENDLTEDDKTWLEKERILTESGYLTDRFIGMTREKFVEEFKPSGRIINTLKKIYQFLHTKGTCDLSTIAKLELLTLNKCFSEYQIRGERHYYLKLHQIDSK